MWFECDEVVLVGFAYMVQVLLGIVLFVVIDGEVWLGFVVVRVEVV